MKRFIALAAAVCILLPHPVFSYSIGDVDVSLIGSLFEQYTDNITSASTNEKADFITGTRVGLLARFEGKLQSLSVAGNLTYQAFAKHHSFNNLSQDANASYTRELSRFDRIDISDSFVRSEEPTSFEDEFGRTSGRYRYTRNRATLGYTRDITRQFSLRSSYSNEVYSYSRQDLADTQQHRFGVEGTYALSSQDTALAAYDYQRKSYDGGSRFNTHRVSGGWRHYFSGTFFAEGRLGQDYISSSFDKKTSRQNYIFASLSKEIDELTRAVISFVRESGATSSTQAVRKSWQATCSLARQLWDRVGVSASGFYGEGKYSSLNIKDKYRGASAGLSYDLTQDIQASLNYSHSNLSSNSSSRDYTVNTVTLGMRFTF